MRAWPDVWLSGVTPLLASGSFGYDPRDDADVVRIARLIADEPELASIDHDDLRTALASVRSGSTFTV